MKYDYITLQNIAQSLPKELIDEDLIECAIKTDPVTLEQEITDRKIRHKLNQTK